MEEVNNINYRINELVKMIHSKNLEGLFSVFDFLLDADEDILTTENAVRIFSNVLRIFLLKEESSFEFIKNIVEKIETERVELLDNPAMEITHTILSLYVSKLSKREAIDKLVEISKKEVEHYNKMHALSYVGTIILSSGNFEENMAFFEELENLKENEDYLVDNLNFDKVTTRFNYDNYKTLIKVTEIKLQKAIAEENEEKINELMEEVIYTTKKLEEEQAISDTRRITLYSLAKMRQSSGYVDLEVYFDKLYKSVDKFKGFVLESYYDYLFSNYPYKIKTELMAKFDDYYENYYDSDNPDSREAFIYTVIDLVSAFGPTEKITLDVAIKESQKIV